ncbi:MAG: fumarylacetoacetate hydrolase family protein [Pseudomonadota bacterium]
MKVLFLLAFLLSGFGSSFAAERYARFEVAGDTYYGLVEGNRLRQLQGGLFPLSALSDTTHSLSEVTLLPPTRAAKVFAVGKNFASHIASSARKPPPLFLKLPSSLTAHGTTVVLPEDADNVHFEGEMVLVIGKQAREVSQVDAADYIFGVTAGNDLTERSWQRSDLQWARAKASDGFGPVGPYIARNIDYSDLLLTTTLNEKIVQQESVKNMIHSPAKVVSYLSQYFTLEPGDLIFMGTPGRTRALKSGDVISVEIEGIGRLSNTIVQ